MIVASCVLHNLAKAFNMPDPDGDDDDDDDHDNDNNNNNRGNGRQDNREGAVIRDNLALHFF